ncbi:hypothetical protein BVX97_06215 [bacterium E08(2017)]|nr:hypothetical protein BVX97_06215 [bacterium E08(2017)]
MNKKVIIYLICAVAMFVLAGIGHSRLIDLRSEYKLDSAVHLENAPPLVAFTTTALGGFRGLLADALWLRISHLQMKGNYFEVVQLADWVTKLEPRNTEIWAYHAWNMAYNISVVMAEEPDRWRWVQNGIRLLRDEGATYNPGDPELYREIGWLFQHKIGLPMDFTHEYYKKMWAAEMRDLFGSGNPDLANLPDDVRKRMIEQYKLLPEVMLKIEHEHGRMDWLLPQAHSAYWAYRGLQIAEDETRSQFLCKTMLEQSLRYMPGKEESVQDTVKKATKHKNILKAIAKKDMDDVRAHIANGADINEQNNAGWSPLHYAVVRGNKDAVQILLDSGANVDLQTKTGKSALIFASDRNHIDIAKLLLEKNADVGAVDDAGWTALHFAAAKGLTEISELLINHEADVNAASNGGGTPLIEAGASAGPDMIELLLKKGADTSIKAKNGKTALDYAIELGNTNAIGLLRD